MACQCSERIIMREPRSSAMARQVTPRAAARISASTTLKAVVVRQPDVEQHMDVVRAASMSATIASMVALESASRRRDHDDPGDARRWVAMRPHHRANDHGDLQQVERCDSQHCVHGGLR
jgi:hypothetical protein